MTSTTFDPIVPLADNAREWPPESTYNREELLTLGRWITSEEKRRRQGKKSEWHQSVWVVLEDVETEEGSDEYQEGAANVNIQGPRPTWSCGTAACAAGHVTIMHGGLPVWENGDDEYWREPTDTDEWWNSLSDTVMEVNGEAHPIPAFAARKLGLNQNDANLLFAGHNRWADMMVILAQFLDMEQDELITLVGGDDLPTDDDE